MTRQRVALLAALVAAVKQYDADLLTVETFSRGQTVIDAAVALVADLTSHPLDSERTR